MYFKQRALYFLVLVMAAGIVVIALGGGLFGQANGWYMQWQHQAFSALCHQISERSFWINGQPMAVCSRCLGIYAGFLGGWILLPFLTFFNFRKSVAYKKVFIVIVGINVLDFLGNLLGFWQNTLISRLVLGLLAGSTAAVLFSGSFFIKTHKQTEAYYGGVTTNILR